MSYAIFRVVNVLVSPNQPFFSLIFLSNDVRKLNLLTSLERKIKLKKGWLGLTRTPETLSPNGWIAGQGEPIATSSRHESRPHLLLDDLGVDFIADKVTEGTQKVSAIKSKKIAKVSVAYSNSVTLKIYYPLLSLSLCTSNELYTYIYIYIYIYIIL